MRAGGAACTLRGMRLAAGWTGCCCWGAGACWGGCQAAFSGTLAPAGPDSHSGSCKCITCHWLACESRARPGLGWTGCCHNQIMPWAVAVSALQLLTRVSWGLVHRSRLGGRELRGDHQDQLLSQLGAAAHEVREAGAGEQVPGGVLGDGVALEVGVDIAGKHLQKGTTYGVRASVLGHNRRWCRGQQSSCLASTCSCSGVVVSGWCRPRQQICGLGPCRCEGAAESEGCGQGFSAGVAWQAVPSSRCVMSASSRLRDARQAVPTAGSWLQQQSLLILQGRSCGWQWTGGVSLQHLTSQV